LKKRSGRRERLADRRRRAGSRTEVIGVARRLRFFPRFVNRSFVTTLSVVTVNGYAMSGTVVLAREELAAFGAFDCVETRASAERKMIFESFHSYSHSRIP
jgi:hypothetical protein